MTSITGNISKAAETKTVMVSGVPTLVTEFHVAENRNFAGGQTQTRFYKITMWRDRGAKLAQWLTTGRLIKVEGYVDAEAWIGKDDGKAKAGLKISNPFTVQLLDRKPEEPDGEDVFAGQQVEA